jgi:hypothetical protein
LAKHKPIQDGELLILRKTVEKFQKQESVDPLSARELVDSVIPRLLEEIFYLRNK